MSRLIDADALIKFIENRYKITWKDDYEGGIKDACTDIIEEINKMPTIEPQQWIPVTERLPEENGLYIVTEIGRWVAPVETRYFNVREESGFWSGHPGDKVLAWMPLPTPYRKDGD